MCTHVQTHVRNGSWFGQWGDEGLEGERVSLTGTRTQGRYLTGSSDGGRGQGEIPMGLQGAQHLVVMVVLCAHPGAIPAQTLLHR